MHKVYCAIDTTDMEFAKKLCQEIGPITGGIKIGMEFYNAHGPDAVMALKDLCPDSSFFIDLKLYDIPNTVAASIKAVSEKIQPAYINVHAFGGAEMMKAAKEACYPTTKLIGVTVLTSFSKVELGDIGIDSTPIVQVDLLAKMARHAGLDGVVCSADEITTLRESCGKDFVLMVPGIRPTGTNADDQKRISTPKQALELGATHLVIGRPITKADNPVQAAQDIMDEING